MCTSFQVPADPRREVGVEMRVQHPGFLPQEAVRSCTECGLLSRSTSSVRSGRLSEEAPKAHHSVAARGGKKVRALPSFIPWK